MCSTRIRKSFYGRKTWFAVGNDAHRRLCDSREISFGTYRCGRTSINEYRKRILLGREVYILIVLRLPAMGVRPLNPTLKS